MSRLLLVCLSALVWCLVSCTDKDKLPKGVLPKAKMQKVLWDVIQAERFRETFIRDSSKDLKAETFKLYAQVFEIHKVTKDEFIKSYKFYMSRPDIARDMFDSLATQANRRREEMYKPKPLDTAKVKQQPAVLPHADSSKAAGSSQPTITPALGPMAFPTAPRNPNKRIKQLPLRKLRGDSLFKLQRKP